MTEGQPKLNLDPSKGIASAQVIYLELDAILDTRLGTLHRLDETFAEKVALNPLYFNRVSDDFSIMCPVTNDAYKAAYKARDLETLKASMVTNISFVLNSVCNELNRQRVETPFTEAVTVELNLWPYVVDSETRMELENAIASLIPIEVAVRSVSIPIENLTLRHVAKQYSGMIIYNFAEWLQLHCREFEQVTIPGVTILAPKLHAEGVVGFKPGDLGEGTEDLDPYEMICMMHAPLMGLDFLDPQHFCMVTHSSIDTYARKPAAQTTQESA